MMEPMDMPKGSFEKQCWLLGKFKAYNITVQAQREKLIELIEDELHMRRRVKAGKMKASTARAKRRLHDRSEEELRDIHQKLKAYKH